MNLFTGILDICWKKNIFFGPKKILFSKNVVFESSVNFFIPDESLLFVLNEFCLIFAGAVRLDCLTVKGRDMDIAAFADDKSIKAEEGSSSAFMLRKASRAAFIFAWVFSNFRMLASMSELGTRPPSSTASWWQPMFFKGGGVAWAGKVFDRCLRLLKIDSAWWRL